MEALSSTAFRRTFHKLTEPTLVNVLGHVIGVWSPIAHVRAGLGHPGDESYALAKVVEQEEEIRRLKRELARRPVEEAWREGLKDPVATHTGFVSQATGDISLIPGRGRQKVIDAALAKVNRTKKGKP